MLKPIHKEHEICCPSCGCVLGSSADSQENEKPQIPVSYEMHLLGSAFDKTTKSSSSKERLLRKEEEVLKQLVFITKSYALPEIFAIETFKILKKKNRGFWSEKEPIKQLINILSKDDNYPYIHKKRAIQEKYKEILSGR